MKTRVKQKKIENVVENPTDSFNIPEPFSHRRMKLCAVMALELVLYSLILSLAGGRSRSQTILIIIAVLCYMPVLIYALEKGRDRGEIILGRANDFKKFTIFFGIACVLMAVSAFLPAYSAFILSIGVILCAATNSTIGLSYTTFIVAVYALSLGISINELSAYIAVCAVSCFVTEALGEKKTFLHGSAIMFASSVIILEISAYLEFNKLVLWIPFASVINSLLAAFIARSGWKHIYVHPVYDNRIACLELIQEKNKLVQEIKKYSEIDYTHARKVSQVSYQCAEYIGADSALAMAAGFYYRVGKLEGEPFVENGVNFAVHNHFPEDMVKILYEYNGELKKPSTIESAIVQMIDCIVTKTELIGEINTVWNREMMIYQTLNEKSSEGLYDESGIGMNQFLKIREFLAKKEGLF